MHQDSLPSALLQAWIRLNRRLSRCLYAVARRVTQRRPGCEDFDKRLFPALLKPGIRVLDVGGGKHPLIPTETKERLGLHVVGLDISAGELAQAPQGAYDSVVVGDVAHARLTEQFDLIVSRTVLEHVADTSAAIANLAGALREGGVMAHFMPCRNALFAIVSRLLGNRIGRAILFSVYPEMRKGSGFAAYYDHCVPREMTQLCQDCGLEVRTHCYFESEYFNFFVPLYAAELLRHLACLWLGAESFAETFTVIARRPVDAAVESSRHAA